jgi:ribosomal protein S8E
MPDMISFFSVTGNRITGFFACVVQGDEITNIKAFSLMDNPNAVLARDMVLFLKENLKKYKKIIWYALKDNPANAQYQKAISLFKGTITKITPKLYCYSISQ